MCCEEGQMLSCVWRGGQRVICVWKEGTDGELYVEMGDIG